MVERPEVRYPNGGAPVPPTLPSAASEGRPANPQPPNDSRGLPGTANGMSVKTIESLPTESASGSRSPRRQSRAAVGRSLRSADQAAAREDYAVALGWLQTVEATGHQLSETYETSRRMWQRALDADRPVG